MIDKHFYCVFPYFKPPEIRTLVL